MMKAVAYEITDVDWIEQDALLQLEGKSYYFQWDAVSEPTIKDALDFLEADSWIRKIEK